MLRKMKIRIEESESQIITRGVRVERKNKVCQIQCPREYPEGKKIVQNSLALQKRRRKALYSKPLKKIPSIRFSYKL